MVLRTAMALELGAGTATPAVPHYVASQEPEIDESGMRYRAASR